MTAPYQVIVIGGGPAGVTAALRARELGATVALTERGRLGGTCTNDGCLPTRVLAHTARLAREARQLADLRLIDATLLDDSERAWLNDYHAQVLAEVGPHVDAPVRKWLADRCAPIGGR